jgi:hypothetical protein
MTQLLKRAKASIPYDLINRIKEPAVHKISTAAAKI